MILAKGGDFKDQSTITNTGTGLIDITGGTLNVLVDVANSGQVSVESGATLALSSGTIDGGTVTVYGTLDLEGTSFLKDGTLNNHGATDVKGAVSFDNETVHNSGIIEIFAGHSLTLDGASVSGGTVTDDGTIHVIGNSAINGAAMTAGQVTVDATLTLDGTTITGGTITDNGTVNVDAGNTLKLSDVALSGGAISNSGTVEITGSGSIASDAFANAGGILLVDALQTLTIDGTTITGGALSNHGTIDSTGDSSIDNAGITNTGIIESTAGTLTIDPPLPVVTLINSGTLEANGGELDITDEPVTNTGTLQAINNSKLKLTSTTVTNSGGLVNVASGSSLDLTSASITGGGTLTNAGALTNVSGIDICEYMPQQAKIADKFTILRGVQLIHPLHTGNEFYSGYPWQENPRASVPGEARRPAVGSVVSRLRPSAGDIPPYVSIENHPDWERAYYAGAEHEPIRVGHAPGPRQARDIPAL